MGERDGNVTMSQTPRRDVRTRKERHDLQRGGVQQGTKDIENSVLHYIAHLEVPRMPPRLVG